MSHDPYFDDVDDFEGDFDDEMDVFDEEELDDEDEHYDVIDEAFEEAYEEEEDEFSESGVRELGDEFEQWNEGIERSGDDGWFYDDEDSADFDDGFGEVDENY